jgi:hypothetical protein
MGGSHARSKTQPLEQAGPLWGIKLDVMGSQVGGVFPVDAPGQVDAAMKFAGTASGRFHRGFDPQSHWDRGDGLMVKPVCLANPF